MWPSARFVPNDLGAAETQLADLLSQQRHVMRLLGTQSTPIVSTSNRPAFHFNTVAKFWNSSSGCQHASVQVNVAK